MLATAKMVGFVVTTDYEKARAFYEGCLGFDFVSLDQFALVLKAGAHHVRISKAPSFTPQQGTVLGWEVRDVSATIDWLTSRGVVFEKYPFAQDQARGIWTTPDRCQVAWFKDPDGNVLSLTQYP